MAGTRGLASESTRRKLLGACATVVGISAAALPRVAHADGANIQHIWNPGVTGNWSVAGSWNAGGVANAAGDYAQNTIGSGNATLDINATVGSLQNIATSAGAWQINASGNNAFTLNGTGLSSSNNLLGDASGNVSSIVESASGLFTVNPNIILLTNTDVGITSGASSGSVTINGNFTASTTVTLNLENNDTTSSSAAIALNGTIGASGSEIDIVNVSTGTKGSITLSNAIGGATGSGATVTIKNNASTGTQGFTISGNLGATVTTVTQNSTTSSMLLSGNNTNFDGAVTISAGTLQLGSATALGGNGSTTGAGGALTIYGGSLASNGTLTLSTVNAENWNGNFAYQSGNNLNTGTGAVALGAANIQVSNTSTGSLTVGGSISGTGNLTFADNSSGSLTLSGATINNGGSITNSGSSSGATTISGNLGVNVTSVTQNSANSAMVLSGNNSSFAGAINISAGVLSISAGNNLGGGAAMVLLNGGTLKTTNTTLLVDTQAITVGANGGTINVSGNGTSQGGRINLDTANTLLGSGALTITGSGTVNSAGGSGVLVMNAPNSYSGALALQSGGLFEEGSSNPVGTSATFTLAANSELAVDTGFTLTNAIAVNGNGSTSVLSFNNGSAGTFSGPINLTTYATIGLRDWYATGTAASGTISGVISGSSTGISTSAGTSTGGVLTLTNANTYTGNTFIAANTSIQLGSGSGVGSISPSSAITDNGTLIVNRSNAATQGTDFSSAAISGTGGFTQAGIGTTTLNVSNSYSGATTVNNGTLKLDFTASSPGSIINSGSALSLGGGTLQILGASGGSTQTFNGTSSTAATGGQSDISAPTTGGTNATVNLGTLTGTQGALVRFDGPAYNRGASSGTTLGGNTSSATGNFTATTSTAGGGIISITTANTGYAAFATVGAYDWAAISTATPNLIVGLSQNSGGYTVGNSLTSGSGGGNWDLTGNVTFANNANASSYYGTFRFNTAGALTLTDGRALAANVVGGLLVTPNVGASNITMVEQSGNNAQGFQASRTANGPTGLTVWQNNTSGELIINASYNNGSNSAATASYTQGGPGTVLLSAVNGYSGQTYLDGGTTVINSSTSLGTAGTGAAINLNGGALLANGNVTLDNTTTARAVNLNGAGGTLSASTNNTLTVPNAIAGAASLTIGSGTLAGTGGSSPNAAVVGNGTVVFSGTNNTYTGVTTLAGNSTLALSASSSTNNISTSTAISVGTGSTLNVTALSGGGITLAGGQALGGTGTVTGNVTVAAGSTTSAGTSMALNTGPTNTTGTLTTGNQTWSVGGKYAVKINETNGIGTGVSGSGSVGGATGWDEMSMSGLNIGTLGSGGNTFAITLSSPGGAISDFNDTQNYVWAIASISTGGPFTPGAILAVTNNAGQSISSSQFTLDTTGFVASNPVLSSSSFYLEAIGSSGGSETLEIGYNATPEPGTGLLVLAGGLPIILSRRRRKARLTSVR